MKTSGRALSCLILWGLVSLPAAAEEQKPRYPKPVERPRPPVGPDGKPLVTVDGRWYSDFGYMDLEQSQWTFEGTYSCCEGRIRGEFIADQIEYFWDDQIYGKGWGYFRLQDEGRRLVGVWGGEDDMGSSGGWRAVRLDERSYEGEPSRWRFAATHPEIGEVRGEAVLFSSPERIVGRLAGSAETRSEVYPEGKLYRHEIFRYLEGRAEGEKILLEWHNPLTERTGTLSLTRSGERLAGLWHISDAVAEPITFERLPEAAEETPP